MRRAGKLVPASRQVPLRYNTMCALRMLEPEMRNIGSWVPRDSVVADVGANYGVYTYALSRIASRVHAFEPVPDCAAALRAWSAPNVDVHEVALSDTTGTASLTIPVVDGTERTTRSSLVPIDEVGRQVDVPTATLDSFELEELSFLKIDVEGHEAAVFRGATRTLERCRPIVLVEIAQRLLVDSTVESVVSFVHDCGYRGELLAPSGPVPAGTFDVDVHQRFENGVRGPGYAYMFLFRPHRPG